MDEIKLKRLERQQIRYEKDIQYLYKIIKSLKLKSNRNSKIVHDLQMRLSDAFRSLGIVRRFVMKEKSLFYFESLSY